MILLSYGSQVEKVSSSYYFLFFGVGRGMVFLYSLLLLSPRMSFLETSLSSGGGLILLVRFLMKLPVYLLHRWLPKVHTESPTLGSVVLAALLLKLGVYGLYIAQVLFLRRGFLLTYLSLLGLLVGVLVCCFQRDSKALVAYSSVVHIAVLLLFFCSVSPQGS